MVVTLPQYLLVAAERYQDWIERGNNDTAKKYWYSVKQHLQLNWPGAYAPYWDSRNLKIVLIFDNPADSSWFWLQHS
jgi:hypothetical protein